MCWCQKWFWKVHYWSVEAVPWTGHSSETPSWTLETLLSICGPDLCNINMFLFRTHHSLVHSLRIQFGGSHVCSRSLTLCVRVQVHYWSCKDVPWTCHSSETPSWTLETLLSVCGPDLCNINMFLFRTHHSLVHSLRIQFGGSHVCSRSLTLCVRVQVHYWSLEEVSWTGDASETHSWTLETLLSVCGPDLCNTNMFLFRTRHSLIHSLRIQFGGSHVCSRSLTLCVRVQVQYWSLWADTWTSHSSETHSWTLETLLCPPPPPHNHSSSDWEEKHCELKHTQWSQVRKLSVSSNVTESTLLHCFPVVTVTWDSCRFNVLDSANDSVESNCWLTDRSSSWIFFSLKSTNRKSVWEWVSEWVCVLLYSYLSEDQFEPTTYFGG